MIKTILNGEDFKTYETLQNAVNDTIDFFKFCTKYSEQKTTNFKKFINELNAITNENIKNFNSKDYTIKFVEV